MNDILTYLLQVNDEDFDLTLETGLLLFQIVELDQQSLDLLLLLLQAGGKLPTAM
jgi:hypothetical protein